MADVFFDIVCPVLGCVIGNMMWLSPLPAVREAKRTGDLGELNPIPWVAAYLNCIAYVTYAILRKDYYVFFANVPGLCLAVYYSLTAITILAKSKREEDLKRMEIVINVVIFGFFFFSFVGFAAGMSYTHSDDEREKAATVLGMAGCAYSILYYFAPLSTAWTVVTTRDSSSLYGPMLIVNLLNSLLWGFYGFIAVNQPAVYIPNVAGCVVTTLLLCLVCIFPKKVKDDADVERATKIASIETEEPLLKNFD